MQIYDSLSQKKKQLHSLKEDVVFMYVCGITPYDTTHLGHAFVYNFFDALKRYLEYKNFTVNYTQNVTDIDDDILKRAKRDKVGWQELAQLWTDKFLADLKSLNIEFPTSYVKATDAIDEIIEIVSSLLKKEFAYERDGNVYFSVEKFKKYGKLSMMSETEMIEISKERGADPDDPRKKHPLDFILWQRSLPDEPFWQSPWGNGRPGWHIECSAMIKKTLGFQIDIHGGGKDLIFPHHESEIAQMESFTGNETFVKHWMHIGMLSYEGEKMSKSLGNLVLVSDLLKTYNPNSIRWLLLLHHYREDWEYGDQDIINAQKEFEGIVNNLHKKNDLGKVSEVEMLKFENLMDDDFNTPEVLKLMLSINERINSGETAFISTLKKISQILGFSTNISLKD